MSYYQGDYYRGGFFSFLGGLAKKAVGLVPGIGPFAGHMMSAAGATLAKHPKIAGAAVGAAKVVAKHPVLSAAAAAGAIGSGAALMRHGSARMPGAVGGTGRRRRRINVCNPRALRRAIRRAHGFSKLAMKTIHLVHPKQKGRFGGFKRRRKK